MINPNLWIYNYSKIGNQIYLLLDVLAPSDIAVHPFDTLTSCKHFKLSEKSNSNNMFQAIRCWQRKCFEKEVERLDRKLRFVKGFIVAHFLSFNFAPTSGWSKYNHNIIWQIQRTIYFLCGNFIWFRWVPFGVSYFVHSSCDSLKGK